MATTPSDDEDSNQAWPGDFMPPELEELHSLSAKLGTKIDRERQQVKKLENMKRRMHGQLEERRRAQGIAGKHESMQAKFKRLQKMENRLEQKQTKLSEISATIAGLRLRINDLRQRREVRKQQNLRTQRLIAAKTKEIGVSLSGEAEESEVCDQLHAQLIATRAVCDNEAATFAQEWKAKTEKLASDRAQIHSKFQAQREKELVKESEGRREAQSAAVQGENAKQLLQKSTSARAREAYEKVKTLEQAFERMMENTDFESIDQLVLLFLDTEQRNFSLYTMINELNREREELEVANRAISSEIERSKGQGLNSDAHRRARFKVFEDRIASAEKQHAQDTKSTEELLTVVEAMKAVVASIFTRIGCNGPLAHQLTMDGVTESNVMQHLGIIEQRLVAVVASYKIKLGLPFSATVISSGNEHPVGAAPAASPGGRLYLPAVEDMDADQGDAEGGTAGDHGNEKPVSIAKIRHAAHKQSWQHHVTSRGQRFHGNGAATTRLPPPT